MSLLTVIKVGGELTEPDKLPSLWDGIGKVQAESAIILVHGGGSKATGLADRLGHRPRIVQGRRVTSDLDLDIVLWAMRGEINARVVAAGIARGFHPVGLCGADGGLVQVDRRPPWMIDGESVDFGWVGDIRSVDPRVLVPLVRADFLPVIAPVGTDGKGELYNVNADTVAGAIAVAMGADRLLLVTESGALRTAADGSGESLPECDASRFEEGIAAGWIRGGMRVKLEVGLLASRTGVGEVRIVGLRDLAESEAGTRVIA